MSEETPVETTADNPSFAVTLAKSAALVAVPLTVFYGIAGIVRVVSDKYIGHKPTNHYREI